MIKFVFKFVLKNTHAYKLDDKSQNFQSEIDPLGANNVFKIKENLILTTWTTSVI